jgi:hypothetical protein
LIALQDADEGQLLEPERGYCIPGLSFSAKNAALFLSAFPMFVPSLSWQNDRLYINGSKIACFAAPNELFAEIRKHHPGFGYRVELDENMNKFAAIWCEKTASLSRNLLLKASILPRHSRDKRRGSAQKEGDHVSQA